MVKWKQWKPIILPENMKKSGQDINIVIDKNSISIEIEFEGTLDYLVLDFGCNVVSYKITNESYRLKTISYLREKYGSEFYNEKTLFELEDSKYLSWVCAEYGHENKEAFFHYCVVTETVLEIITTSPPEVFTVKTPEIKGLKRASASLLLYNIDKSNEIKLLQQENFGELSDKLWEYRPRHKNCEDINEVIDVLKSALESKIEIIKRVIEGDGVEATVDVYIHRLNGAKMAQLLNLGKVQELFVESLKANLVLHIEQIDDMQGMLTLIYENNSFLSRGE